MVKQVNHFGGFEEANTSEQLCTDVYAFIQNRDTHKIPFNFSLFLPPIPIASLSAFAYILLFFFLLKKKQSHNYFLLEIFFTDMSSRINFPW